jgi:hypothetical protein
MQSISLGVPQGSILGPLLFLMYINDIDCVSKLLYFCLFADDTNILYHNSDYNDLCNVMNAELCILSDWFRANRLSINIKKTNFILFGFKRIPLNINLNSQGIIIDSQLISRVTSTKFLGIIIDEKLTWQPHTTHVALKIANAVNIMSRLKYKLPKHCLLTLYYSLLYPHFNYGILVWGSASNTVLHKLVLFQKRALRIIDKTHYLSHTNPIFKKYRLLKFSDIYKFSCCIFTYKFKNNMLPLVCKFLLKLFDVQICVYSMRTVADFFIPYARTTLRQKCISIQGPMFWNSLPSDIKSSTSIFSFKNKIRCYFINHF